MRHTSYIDTVSDESLYCVMWFKNLISLLISSHFHDGHHKIIEFSHVNLFVIIGIPFFEGKVFCLDKYHRLYYPYFTEYKVSHMQDETYHMLHMILVISTFSMFLRNLLNIIRFFELSFSYYRVIIQVCPAFNIENGYPKKANQITNDHTYSFLKVVLIDFDEI